MRATVYQHVGGRPDQQDRYAFEPPRGVFAVADGMGGHVMGADAAQAAVDALLRSRSPAEAFKNAHAAVRALASRPTLQTRQVPPYVVGKRLPPPGSTLTALWVAARALAVGHVGDSRCYVLSSSGSLEQVTSDHAARSTPVMRGGLTQYLGMPSSVIPQIVRVPTRSQTILLCSDGLTGALSDDELRALLRRGADAEALVDAAVASGRCSDNVTALVVRLGA